MTTNGTPLLTRGRTVRRASFDWVGAVLWAVRVGFVVVILWGVIGAITLSAKGEGLSADAWRGLTVTGLAQGSMYGLIALGYSMVYGVLGFINFAHGEVFMSGAMVGFFAADSMAAGGMWDDNFFLALAILLVASAATSMLVAVLVERIAYRPLRGSPRLIPLITSIGMSFFLQYTFRGLFGSGFLTYPQLPESLREDPFQLLGFTVQKVQVIVIALAAVAMIGLFVFVTRTKTGRAMRAVAEDKEIAGLMGINVDRVIVVTFAVGGAMAGVAGSLWALLFRKVSFFTGFLPGIKAFTAAVLGGIGNMAGAYLGGVSLGLFESLGPQVVLGGWAWELPLPLLLGVLLGVVAVLMAWKRRRFGEWLWQAAAAALGIAFLVTLLVPALRDFGFTVIVPGQSQLKDVVAFTALVLVLIFRPTGLLGERLAVEERG
jgi:branched-chain amino acid transport system permease protein